MAKPNPIKGVLQKAAALDRRRQAQIVNQVASINRLLVDGSYDGEMKILHEGAAALKAENDELSVEVIELRERVRELEDALVGTRDSEATTRDNLRQALTDLNAPVSESGDEPG